MYKFALFILISFAVVLFLKEAFRGRSDVKTLKVGVDTAVRHISRLIKNLLWCLISIVLMIGNFASIRTLMEAFLDAEFITFIRNTLQYLLGSASVMFALQTIMMSALLAIGVFSSVALMLSLYLSFCLYFCEATSFVLKYDGEVSLYSKNNSINKRFLTFRKLII